MKSVLFKIIILSFILQLSCLNDADRGNPFDPGSKDFENAGVVRGQTLTFYSPFSALQDVEVSMQPGTFVTRSNVQGQFSFDRVPAGRYQITALKAGYAPVSDTVQINFGETTPVQMNLDGLPLMPAISLNSCHISRWFPQNDLFLLEVTARVQDPDGFNDIDLVLIAIAELNFVDTLAVTPSPEIFKLTILESQLPGRNLHDVLGREIVLSARDHAGFASTSAPKFLARIIEETPVTVSPQGLEIVATPTPTLSWQVLDLPFRVTYRVELFRVDFGLNTLVWSQSGIDRPATSITVPDSLVAGTYFWTVAVVDEFGNCSRSKEASFQVN